LHNVVRHLRVEIVIIEVHRPFAVKGAGGGEGLSIRREIDGINAALHGWPLADAERVVTDATLNFASNAVSLRDAIRSADQELIPLRMAGDGMQTTAESSQE
jgi:hypothetical protein